MFSANGRTIDYVESGPISPTGPTIVFVPGSFSTHVAWRGIQKRLPQEYRFVSTSACGYGATEDTRSLDDLAMSHQIRVVEAVVEHAGGGPVHLVGHSMGGMICFATALAGGVEILSLTTFEANPLELAREQGGDDLYRATRQMSDAFEAAYRAGEENAAGRIIDFWGKDGDFQAMPDPVKAYCRETTWSNVLDWRAAFEFNAPKADYERLSFPVLAVRGGACNPVMRAITDALCDAVPNIRAAVVPDAGHFLISTHPTECADVLAGFLEEVGA